MIVVERGDGRYLVTTTDHVSRHIFVFGDYERDLMATTMNLIDDLPGMHGFLEARTFLDVGANLGTSTIPAISNYGAARAAAFEPAPANYAILRCNLILNGLDDVVDTYPVAISDHDGEELLELSGESTGDHRVRSLGSSSQAGCFGEDARDTIPVATLRLDSLVEDGRIDPAAVGLLWVDVQGHEAQVLAGASSILRHERPIPAVIEFWPYGLRRSNGLDRLCQLVAENYRLVIDVRASERSGSAVSLPASDLIQLADVYDGISFTDLVLTR